MYILYINNNILAYILCHVITYYNTNQPQLKLYTSDTYVVIVKTYMQICYTRVNVCASNKNEGFCCLCTI